MFQREVFYEVHVKGFSMLNKDIDESVRGKWLGLCSPWALDHYKELGVTVIQLMPIFKNNPDYKGKFWGYCNISFFETNPDFGSHEDMVTMLNTLHEHGFKVIIDTVLNHSGEVSDGVGMEGVVFSKEDHTGCGFPIAVNEPESLETIKEALGYWLTGIGFDGCRFDLAGCLGREEGKGFNPNSEMLQWLEETYVGDKIFTGECYDLGGNFEHLFPDWLWRINNNIRDQIRDQHQYIHTEHGTPENNIGFLTVHDGMVLRDLTEYSYKNNEANGEDGRDGNNDNKSFNCGVDGPTDDPQILYWRQSRADWMLNALQNYTGHVLLLQGDVSINDKGRWIGRMTNTQFGNNNVYCQDNETGWVIWDKLKGEPNETK